MVTRSESNARSRHDIFGNGSGLNDVNRFSGRQIVTLLDYMSENFELGPEFAGSDAPLAERKAQALTLDRNLLRELLGQAELRELIDAIDPEIAPILKLG